MPGIKQEGKGVSSGYDSIISPVLIIFEYADKFGFTESKVSQILTAFQAEDHADIIRDWYNRYSFGGHIIFNPWSLISYIQAIPNPPSPKWLNTSSNILVYEELSSGWLKIKRDLEELLSGGELRYPLLEILSLEISEKIRKMSGVCSIIPGI